MKYPKESSAADLMVADMMLDTGGGAMTPPNYTGDTAKDGYTCLEKMPLSGPFWTKDPKGGLA